MLQTNLAFSTPFPPWIPPAISPSLPPCRNPERIWVRCQANVLPANKSRPVHPRPRCSLLIPLWVWLNVTVSKYLSLSLLLSLHACQSWKFPPLKFILQQPAVWDKCPHDSLSLALSHMSTILSSTAPLGCL